jgi:tRNA1Val (adenine37-N6)-methyltransferase
MERNMNLKENERIDDLGINDLKIIQNTDYFCFGTDSVLLANFITSNSSNNIILDLCSGGGVIPIIVSAKYKCSKVFAIELQDEMFDLLKRNIELNKLEEKISIMQGNITDFSSIRQNIIKETGSGSVNIITVNPPYKPKGRGIGNEHNVKYIARHEEMCNLEDIFLTSSKLLEYKGKLYLVHKPERIVDLLAIARKYNLEAKRIRYVYPRVDTKPSIVLIEYIKGGGNETLMLPALIEYNEDGSYTDEIYKIYGMEKKNDR